MATFYGWHHGTRSWTAHRYDPGSAPHHFSMGETRCSLAGLQLSHREDVVKALHYRNYYGSRFAIFYNGTEVEPLCSGVTPVGTLGIVQACINRLETQHDDLASLETGLNTMCYLNTEDLMNYLELGSIDNPLTWHLISAMGMVAQFTGDDDNHPLVNTLAQRSRFDLIKALGVALPVSVSSEGSKTQQWQHLDGSGVVSVVDKHSLHHVVSSGVISADGLFPSMSILVEGLKRGVVSQWRYDGIVTSEMVYDMHHLSTEDLQLLHQGTDDYLNLISGWLLGLRDESYNDLPKHATADVEKAMRNPFVDTDCFKVTVGEAAYTDPETQLDDHQLYYVAAVTPGVLAVRVEDPDLDDDEYMLMPEEASVHLWSCDIEELWQQLDSDQRRQLFRILDRYSYHSHHDIHQARIDALWQWHQQL